MIVIQDLRDLDLFPRIALLGHVRRHAEAIHTVHVQPIVQDQLRTFRGPHFFTDQNVNGMPCEDLGQRIRSSCRNRIGEMQQVVRHYAKAVLRAGE